MNRQDWFTADTHFGHANIIRYCKRPFKCFDDDGRVILDDEGREVVDAEKHDTTLIDNINSLVKPNDTLYHLGDFSMNPAKRDKTNNAQFYLDQINCKNIILITGNHDPHYANCHAKLEFAGLFKEVHDQLRIKVWLDGVKHEIFLNHYAMRVWNKSHHGVWHLYGHSHGTLPDNPDALSFDVGVDCHEYKPLNLRQISAIMAKKTWQAIDYHGRQRVGSETSESGPTEG